MIEAFTSLEKAAKDMNLFINQEKTKYMPVTKNSHANYPNHLEVGPYKFQVIHSLLTWGQMSTVIMTSVRRSKNVS